MEYLWHYEGYKERNKTKKSLIFLKIILVQYSIREHITNIEFGFVDAPHLHETSNTLL
jgi:hypothetical protein